MLKRKTKVKKLAINKLLIIMATICTMFAIAIILLPILSKGEMQLLSKSGIKLKENYATTDTNTWDVSVNGDKKVMATLDENGLLTISGTGKIKDMEDYEDDEFGEEVPWYSVRNQIKSVKIEEGVTRIGDCAFYSCEKLTQIEISDSVTSIGDNAFCGCIGLTGIEIPSKVTTIEDFTFMYCSSLKSIEIPSSVTSIGEGIFSVCKSLTSIEVDKDNTKYCDEYGVLYSKNKTKLIAYPPAKKATEYEILSSVTTIGDSAFSECNNLISISIPNKVTTIDEWAFRGCSSLTSIKIPSGVTKIDDETFRDCSSLTNVEIPTTVTTIGGNAFSECSSLTSIEIPSAVTKIGDSAFYGCENLTNIAIPTKATTIGSKTFYGCRNITNIEIPSTVTSIGGAAFGGCEKLASISVKTSNTKYSDEYGVLYSKDKTKLIAYPSAKEKTEYEILSSVTSIEGGAFDGCTKLKTIKIPSVVESIANDIFIGCTSLTSIEVENDNTKYSTENGVLYTKDKTGLIAYPAGKTETEYTISSSITDINEYAFNGCKNLKNIKVEQNNTKYSSDNGVLYTKDKKKLIAYPAGKTEIYYEILNNTTDIADRAFYECNNLRNVTIPNSVTRIGWQAFGNSTNLTNLQIPSSVTNIDNWAFGRTVITNFVDLANNNNIELPEILKGTQDVNDILFSESALALENCTLDGTTIKIDKGAYYAKIKVLGGRLYGLTYIIFHNTWDITENQDGSIVGELKDNGTLTISGEGETISLSGNQYIPWDQVKEMINTVNIQGKITAIYDYTFNGCSNLTSIKIPNEVIFIGENAFENNEDLTIICKNGTTAQEYAKENNINYIIIEGITPKTTLAEIKANLKGEMQCEIVDLEGNTVTDTSTIGTGYKVKTVGGEEYSIIVWGDFTGDGKISVAELAIASRVAAQAQELEEEQKPILDISGDGEVKITDLAAISKLATE